LDTLKKRPLVNVEWRKYISTENHTLNEYLKDFGEEYLWGVFELISTAQSNNLPSIILIEFAKSDVVSVISKSDYTLALHRLLKLCELLEHYEICSEIAKYQKQFELTKELTKKKTQKQLTT